MDYSCEPGEKLEESYREIFDDSVDWCLYNNCQDRWALRWKQVDDDLEHALEMESEAAKEEAAATTRKQLRAATMKRKVASLAVLMARNARLSTMAAQERANEEWLERRRRIDDGTSKFERIKLERKNCIAESVREKRAITLANRVCELDKIWANRFGKQPPKHLPVEEVPVEQEMPPLPEIVNKTLPLVTPTAPTPPIIVTVDKKTSGERKSAEKKPSGDKDSKSKGVPEKKPTENNKLSNKPVPDKKSVKVKE